MSESRTDYEAVVKRINQLANINQVNSEILTKNLNSIKTKKFMAGQQEQERIRQQARNINDINSLFSGPQRKMHMEKLEERALINDFRTNGWTQPEKDKDTWLTACKTLTTLLDNKEMSLSEFNTQLEKIEKTLSGLNPQSFNQSRPYYTNQLEAVKTLRTAIKSLLSIDQAKSISPTAATADSEETSSFHYS